MGASDDLSGKPIAHTRGAGDTHDLLDHLRGTAALARDFAAPFGAGEAAYVAGLWHDLGKYAPAFQAKLRAARDSALNDEDAEAQRAAAQKVDHSTAGAVHAATKGLAGSLVAFAIAGHHAGLADQPDLGTRLKEKAPLLDVARAGGVPTDLLEAPLVADLDFARGLPPDEAKRRLEFWTRMVFSALCDADFLDTEAFMDAGRAAQRPTPVPLSSLAAALDAFVASKENGAASAVNDARRTVRLACEARAMDGRGLFTLTVPTGGGKTLAAMNFALRHAVAHGLERVIVAVPYNAILEQNAAVYRAAFASLGDEVIVEHHSALDPDRESFRNKLASENWDAPVVVTTTVQLFESLYARRPGACRKLHRLARSVIILDEAQTLPPKLLPAILDGLRELTARYGSTVVSCTATQPAFRKTPHLPCGLDGMREIVPDPAALFTALRRVAIELPGDAPAVTWTALAADIAREDDVLAIVHRRSDARELLDAVDAAVGHRETVHLSALQCPAHRSALLDDVQRRKAAGQPVRVVSTQLVEAGVDLDFATVFRALAGFDALAQAAGRCNREGRRALGAVRVFRAPTQPPPGVLRSGLDVAMNLLRELPDLDVLAPDAQRRYFERLYKNVGAEKDAKGIQELRARLLFASVAEAFTMIEDDWSAPVVVPFGDGATLLDRLRHGGPDSADRRTLRKLQRFTVSVPRRAHDELLRRGHLERVAEAVTAVPAHRRSAYDPRVGLDLSILADGAADIGALVV